MVSVEYVFEAYGVKLIQHFTEMSLKNKKNSGEAQLPTPPQSVYPKCPGIGSLFNNGVT